jgi:hypothetical protein
VRGGLSTFLRNDPDFDSDPDLDGERGAGSKERSKTEVRSPKAPELRARPQPLTLQPCNPVTLPPCHPVTLPPSHPATLLPLSPFPDFLSSRSVRLIHPDGGPHLGVASADRRYSSLPRRSPA